YLLPECPTSSASWNGLTPMMSGLPTWEGQEPPKNEIAILDLPMVGSPIFRSDRENQEAANAGWAAAEHRRRWRHPRNRHRRRGNELRVVRDADRARRRSGARCP